MGGHGLDLVRAQERIALTDPAGAPSQLQVRNNPMEITISAVNRSGRQRCNDDARVWQEFPRSKVVRCATM